MSSHASMNRIYRLVFNAATGMYVAVAETARGRGKAGRSASAAMLAALTAVGGVGGISGAAAQGLPAGGAVASGSATISQTSSAMTINQSSNSAILNWQSFSIGAGNAVQFVQPSASAVALNRVIGNSASEILGSLSANGKVMLVNQNGILMGSGAQVNTGGFIGSTLNIKDSDFLAGRYIFDISNNAGGTAGTIINNGRINTPSGYAVLIAPQVTNNGFIAARQGTVAIGAGNKVSLDMVGDGLISLKVDQAALNAAIVNSGTIQANGGTVLLKASSANALFDTVINSTGIIRADSIASVNGRIILDGGATGITQVTGEVTARGLNAGETGGQISVLGDKVGLLGNAKLDASGDAGGGTVLVGGNWQGNGPERNASRTIVGSNASIDVSATNNGHGGTAVVWADGRTDMSGTIKATGGINGGNGGNVETSGKAALDLKGRVDVTAANGQGGQWLLDPNSITIAAANNNSLDPVVDFTFRDNGDFNQDATVSATALGAALTNGNTVTVQTSNRGDVMANGIITVDSAITATGAGTLNLIANRGITVNAAITNAANFALNVGLYDGSTGTPATIATAGGQAGGTLTTGAGTITTGGGKLIMVSGSNINLSAAVSTANGDVTLKTVTGLFINANLDAGSGTVRVQSGGGVSQGATAAITAQNLGVNATLIDLTGTNNRVGEVAMNATTGTVKFRTESGITVGTITADGTLFNAVIGMTTNNKDISLHSNNTNGNSGITINQAINAGTGTVRLAAVRSVVDTTNGVITAANLGILKSNTNIPNDFNLSNASHAVSGNFAVGSSNGSINALFKNSTGFNVGAITADAGAGFTAINGISGADNLTLTAGGTIRQSSGITVDRNLSVTATAGNINLFNTSNSVIGTVNLSAAAGGVAYYNRHTDGIKVGNITAATSPNATDASNLANFTASDAALTGVVLLQQLINTKAPPNIERIGTTKIVADRTLLLTNGSIGSTVGAGTVAGMQIEGAAGSSTWQVFLNAGATRTASIVGPTAVPQFYNVIDAGNPRTSPQSTTYNGTAMMVNSASTAMVRVIPVAAVPPPAPTPTPVVASTSGANDALKTAQLIAQNQAARQSQPDVQLNPVVTAEAEQSNNQVSSDLRNATRVEPITIPSCAPGAARRAAPGQCG